MSWVQEFKGFLNEYGIIALAIAFVMGQATNRLVQSLVNSILMPLLTPFIPGGAWQEAKFNIGPVALGWGDFAAALLNFLLIALVVFVIAKKLLKEEKVTKK